MVKIFPKKKIQTLIPAPAWSRTPRQQPFHGGESFSRRALAQANTIPEKNSGFIVAPSYRLRPHVSACLFYFCFWNPGIFGRDPPAPKRLSAAAGCGTNQLAKLQNYLPSMEMHELHTCICRISRRPTAAILLKIQPQIWICHATPACTSNLINPSPTTALCYWRYKSNCTGALYRKDSMKKSQNTPVSFRKIVLAQHFCTGWHSENVKRHSKA
jgi:hypothetical protein